MRSGLPRRFSEAERIKTWLERPDVLPIEGGGLVVHRPTRPSRKPSQTTVFVIDGSEFRLIGPTTQAYWPGAALTIPYERTESDDAADSPRMFTHLVPVR